MGDIVYQNKDIASKTISERLIGKRLAPFGLPHLHIVDILPTNLPTIEGNELRLDNLFLLNDGSLAIIDYESEFDRENFVKYMNYIARVLKRYAMNKRLNEIREIRMIVIYTADVESAQDVYELGGVTLKIEAAYLVNRNSNHIYQRLRYKIEHKETLSEEELMELMILPLTAKGSSGKQEYIRKAADLAKKLPETKDTHTVLAGLLTFTDKFIEKNYAERLRREVFMLTQVEQIIFDEAVEWATEKNIISVIHMCKDLGLEKLIVLKQISERFSISELKAQDYIEAHWS